MTAQRRKRARWVGGLALGIVLITAAPIILVPGGAKHGSNLPPADTRTGRGSEPRPRVLRILWRTILVEHAAGTLPAPLQDPSSAAVGGKALLFGSNRSSQQLSVCVSCATFPPSSAGLLGNVSDSCHLRG